MFVSNKGEESKEDPGKTPKRKKETTALSAVPAVSDTTVAVDAVVRDALKIFLRKQAQQQSEAKKGDDINDALVATNQEFMNNFIIFGYDFEGNPVGPLVVAHNQQEADALNSFLVKFYQYHVGNGGNFR
jgi:hypothetical protein